MDTSHRSRATSRSHARPTIALVGLPGSGKSTIGREVAAHFSAPFLDFDREIERRARASVAQIFERLGEQAFRAMERALTEELVGSRGMVIAPGGGWGANLALVGLLRPDLFTVYLRVPPEVAMSRIAAENGDRPLLFGSDAEAKLRGLFDQRRAHYEQADATIDGELLTPQEVTKKLVSLVHSL